MLKFLKQNLIRKYLLVASFSLISVLLIFLVYATSSTKFTLDNVVICKNLDKEMAPIDIVKEETSPSDRIILSFDYSNANLGQTLRIIWYYNDKVITDDTLKLSKSDGNRAVALLSISGSYLPKGAYRAEILIGDNLLKQISFVIS